MGDGIDSPDTQSSQYPGLNDIMKSDALDSDAWRGPFTVDVAAEDFDAEAAAEGLVLCSLPAGKMLRDIAWATPVDFDENTYMERLGDGEDINLIRVAGGYGWDNDVDLKQLSGNVDAVVGGWSFPTTAQMAGSLLALTNGNGYFPGAIIIPEGKNLVVQITDGDGSPTTATEGRIDFYILAQSIQAV